MAGVSGEQIGSAYVSLGVDTSQMEAQLNSARQKVDKFGESVKDAYNSSNQQAKAGITYLEKYVRSIGLSGDEFQLLKAKMRGVPTEVIEKAKTEMLELRDAIAQANKAQAEVQARDSFIQSLRQQAEAVGKTRAELLQLKAAELGVSNEASAYIAKLAAQERALENTTKAVNKYGLTQKQQTAAMRQVPAQITDIFTSLQGGQNPLTVLIQQGGQLRDIFNGVRPAASALGAQLLKMVNPFTVAAAAIGTFGYLLYLGQARLQDFDQALIFSGDKIGLTAEQLQKMSVAIGGVTGTGSNDAAQALTRIAQGGRLAGESVGSIAEAAVRMHDVTGKAIDDTVAEYERLADAPGRVSLELSKKENFLTLELYQQIRALELRGDVEAAYKLAAKARADSQNERAQRALAQMGFFAGAIHQLGNNWDTFWGKTKDYFVGLDQSISKFIASLGRLSGFLGGGSGGFLGAVGLAFGGVTTPEPIAPTAAPKPKASSVILEQIEAINEANKAAVKTALQQQQDEEAKLINLYAKAGYTANSKAVKDAIAASRAAFDKQQADRAKKPMMQNTDRSEVRAELQVFEDQLTKERAILSNENTLLEAQFGARLLSAKDYYEKSASLAERSTAAEVTAIQGQIDALKKRNDVGRQAIDNQRQIGELEARLTRVREEGATKLRVIALREQQDAKQRRDAMLSYKDGLDSTTQSLKDQLDTQLRSFYLSSNEAALQTKLTTILNEKRDALKRLNDEYERSNKTQDDKDKLAQGTSAVEAAAAERTRAVLSGQAAVDAAQADWVAGFKRGLKDWIDATNDANTQVASLTRKTFDSLAQAIGDAVATGKFAFKDLIRSILADIARFFAQKAVAEFASFFLELFTGGSSGGIGDISAKLFKHAKGNVFTNSPSLSAYSGQVVNSPTPFFFAKGASLGVMGEAGSEAIMPLGRTNNGELGVKIAAGGGTGGSNITFSQSFTFIAGDGANESNSRSQGDANLREAANQMQAVAKEAVMRMMLPGGALHKLGVHP